MSALDFMIESPIAAVAADSKAIDCLIIGSGTAGTTTALVLAAHGYRVVILEAGPLLMLDHVGNASFRRRDALLLKINDAVSYDTSWLSDADIDDGRYETRASNNKGWSLVGGRTVFWSGCAPRFNEWDFERWPISYYDMAPFYDEAEELIRVSGGNNPDRPSFFRSAGQDQAIEALCRAGLSARPAPLALDTRRVGNGHVRGGFDSAVNRLLESEYLTPFGETPGLSLVTQAIAVRLRTRSDQVDAVDVLDRRSGATFSLAPRHVVLAGGAIQSTRLALASGLDKESPDIGHYISDHIFFQGVIKLAAPIADPAMSIFVDATTDRPFHIQIQGPFQETWYTPLNPTFWLDCDPKGLYLVIACFGISTVERQNRVVLVGRGDRDFGGMRDYCVAYDRSAGDRDVIAEMNETLLRVARVLGGQILRSEVNSPGAALHEIGGLRMAGDAEHGVTDSYGRFWRLRNLSVADSGAWPSQGAANPYLTITAWSLRHARALALQLEPRT
jgi:choline dehydrogenase-like flavoprotein